ncbi:hypothetical protein [Paenibacillus xylaniclasticus]|uniref:hypothetical protein n=1 Tax=Paenibacillus xylaniclasticus TaxID=588083 RepID=UPI000FD7B0BD|nr:hypothetical protein [Paenibacillus xylaniclasticus]
MERQADNDRKELVVFQLTLGCNSSFSRIVQSLKQERAGKERFDHILWDKKSSITYRVELTRVRSKGVDISNCTGLELERNLALNIYTADEIEIQDASVLLNKAAATPYILATG